MSSIKQRTLTIDLDDRKIIVRRMKWQAARAFLKKLAGHLAKLGTSLDDILPRLPEIVTSADDLATDLVINSSDLTAEELDQLDSAQAMAVIAAAVELNLGDDLKNSCAGIAAHLAALTPATKTSTGA